MKTLRQFFATCVLCLLLASTVMAGDIPMPGVIPPPPPPPDSQSSVQTADGDIPMPGVVDPLTELAINILML